MSSKASFSLPSAGMLIRASPGAPPRRRGSSSVGAAPLRCRRGTPARGCRGAPFAVASLAAQSSSSTAAGHCFSPARPSYRTAPPRFSPSAPNRCCRQPQPLRAARRRPASRERRSTALPCFISAPTAASLGLATGVTSAASCNRSRHRCPASTACRCSARAELRLCVPSTLSHKLKSGKLHHCYSALDARSPVRFSVSKPPNFDSQLHPDLVPQSPPPGVRFGFGLELQSPSKSGPSGHKLRWSPMRKRKWRCRRRRGAGTRWRRPSARRAAASRAGPIAGHVGCPPAAAAPRRGAAGSAARVRGSSRGRGERRRHGLAPSQVASLRSSMHFSASTGAPRPPRRPWQNASEAATGGGVDVSEDGGGRPRGWRWPAAAAGWSCA